MSELIKNLQSADKKSKKKYFTASQMSVSYPTEFLPVDFKNGEWINVNGKDGEERYASLGIRGGSFVTIVGKPGVAKTSWCIMAAWNIVKRYKSSLVYHCDIEKSTSYTRVMNLTGMTHDEVKDKYILKDGLYLEDVYDIIYKMAKEREENPDNYKYIAPKPDEFGNPISLYEPTVVIIDSTASLTSNSVKLEELPQQTEAMRTAQKIKQFYKMLIPLISKYNIIILSINHLNAAANMSIVKTQSQIMYMKQENSIPGGMAPLYYANTLMAFISRSKLKKEDDGFDGFMLDVEFWKSRSNKANQKTQLVFDLVCGFDPVLSLLAYADDQGLLDGRNPYKYFKGYPDKKFDARKFKEIFVDDEELRSVVREAVMPYLYTELSEVSTEARENKRNLDMLSLLNQ